MIESITAFRATGGSIHERKIDACKVDLGTALTKIPIVDGRVDVKTMCSDSQSLHQLRDAIVAYLHEDACELCGIPSSK